MSGILTFIIAILILLYRIQRNSYNVVHNTYFTVHYKIYVDNVLCTGFKYKPPYINFPVTFFEFTIFTLFIIFEKTAPTKATTMAVTTAALTTAPTMTAPSAAPTTESPTNIG